MTPTTKKLAAGAGVLALVGAMTVLMQDDDQLVRSVLSPDGTHRVDLIGKRISNPPGLKVELYGIKLPAGLPVKLNLPIGGDDDVDVDYFVQSDSKRVAFRAGNVAFGHFDLFSSRIEGGDVRKLNQPVAGMVFPGIKEVYDKRVRYVADVQQAGGATGTFVVPIAGGTIQEEIMRGDFETGTFAGWTVRP